MAAPTIDNTSGNNGGHGAGPFSFSLATSTTNVIICVAVYIENNGGAAATVTGITGGSLSFTNRRVINGPTGGRTELWWALAPVSLGSTAFSVAISGSVDATVISAWGVKGCNAVNPWDSNTSLTTATDTKGNAAWTPTSTPISTSQANNFLIFIVGADANFAGGTTVATGFTSINKNAQGFIEFCDIATAFKGVTATQTSQTFAWGSSLTPDHSGASIFDALTADAGGVGGPTLGEASLTEMEALGAAAPTAKASQTRIDVSAKNPSTLAKPGQTRIEGVAANPIKLARPSLTLMEVLLRHAGAPGPGSGAVEVDMVHNVAILLGVGNQAVIYNNRLSATSPQVSDASAIVYQLVTPPVHGFLTVNGQPATSWTQADINNGLLIYNATDIAYGYAYEAATTFLFTSETPQRESGGNAITYKTSGPDAAGVTDSFTFNFTGATTVVPAAPITFNATLVNVGFVPSNVLPGEDGVLSTTVVDEQFSTAVDDETMEL